MPDPPAKKPPRVMLSARVGPAGLATAMTIAKRRGITKTEMVREALADWVQKYK